MEQEYGETVLISSSSSFEGYKITKYAEYISGTGCVDAERKYWDSKRLSSTLVKIRADAIEKLKEAAQRLGCNAVVGVDFEYLTMAPQHENPYNTAVNVLDPYAVCVIASGNAVVIEKE